MEDVWPEFEQAAAASPSDVEIRPARPEEGERTLQALQVTTRSALGVFALHTEITLVDHGWLRLLGAGGPGTRCSLLGLDGEGLPQDLEIGLVIGFDVVGGFFAVDGGGLGGIRGGSVHYLAPDTLRWESLERGHGDFVRWVFAADLGGFYGDLRWDGWEEEVERLAPDEVLSLYPPAFMRQGKDLGAVTRKPAPVHEVWSVAHDFRRQLGIDGRPNDETPGQGRASERP